MKAHEFRCKWRDTFEIWKIADQVRNQHWPDGKIPVDVEAIIESGFGLDIIPMHNLASRTDMDAFLKRDLTGIYVDYDRYMLEYMLPRTRFSLAHELGHYVLHKETYSRLQIADFEDWKDLVLNRNYKAFEVQANQFAGRLLVPQDFLVKEIQKSYESLKKNGLLDYLASDPKEVLSMVSPTLCKPFEVSTEVIIIRTLGANLWPPTF